MSTEYRTSRAVPTKILCDRLEELSCAIANGKRSIEREFTMRVPAEVDRDPDLVLSEAARRIADFEYKNKRLIEALQAAYRKHVGNDDSIGWHELSDIMSCALPEVMGDAEFCAWVEKRIGH
jgi:lipid II:glycine glycyltransferase (peptidoglycan interpeptide bridge formation enzyme)